MTISLDLFQLTIRRDNHVWFFPTLPGQVAAVDPGEGEPVLAFLQQSGWHLSHILLTHHHQDHQGGAAFLRQQTGAQLVGAAADAHRLPDLDQAVREGNRLQLGDISVLVLETPGHTLGHVVYLAGDRLFCGDTLFHAGCGRLFEGSPEQMWHSLQRLANLPGSTRLCPGHEYSLANLDFLLHLQGDNQELTRYRQQVTKQLARGEVIAPIVLDFEKKINPFLNCHAPWVARLVGREGEEGATLFAALRQQRNLF